MVVVVVRTRCVTSMFILKANACTELRWRVTWESDSRRPRHSEPSTMKNSSSSRAEKRALTSMRTECEKCRKMHHPTSSGAKCMCERLRE